MHKHIHILKHFIALVFIAVIILILVPADRIDRDRIEILSELDEETNNCPKPDKEYADMWLLNVGQDISLFENTYVPKNLVPLDSNLSTIKSICLEREARDAFREMVEDAKEEGIFIKATSAFRSYEKQKSILNTTKRQKVDAEKFVAKPGYSEHQLGTTVDISGRSIGYGSANISFDKTVESEWLKENAYMYGFVQSYPYKKEDITGYSYEPWHYRYLGLKNARRIHRKNITITEFLKG